MSWLERRRPKKSHPWPPLETRDAVLIEREDQEWYRCAREWRRRCERELAALRSLGLRGRKMTINATPGEQFEIDPHARSPAHALDYGEGVDPNPRSGDLAKGWF